MDEAIESIKDEDETQGLYSNSKSKAADVKLQKFNGKPEQDFSKFKIDMIKGFKSNKVRKEDQVKKLRENLFDQPKTLIPVGMDSIDDAWKILTNVWRISKSYERQEDKT